MTNNQHGQVPDALRLAEQYDHGDPAAHGNAWKAAVCTELRRQHARIAELESELEAVGAGGVQALSAAPEAFLKSVIALCSHRGYSPANIEAWDKDDKWIADLWRQAESMLAASPTPTAEQQIITPESGAVYAELPDFDSGDEPIWEAVFKWKAASPGPDASKKAMAVESAIINSLRDYADRTHALRMEQAAPKAAPGEPSDVDIDDFLDSPACITWVIASNRDRYRLLVRAVLAKWAAPQQGAQVPVAWESTTPGYIKYITQARYEKFSPAVRRWYKPYRCSGCAERGAGFDACDMATAAAQGFRRGQAAAKQEG